MTLLKTGITDYNKGTKRSLKATVNLNTCTYKLTVSIENLHHDINLFNYKWGK
jgi:hypothetical protein